MAVVNAVIMLLICIAADAKVLERVLVEEAVEDGAVCLDGSPPGYFIGKGSGSGASKWIIHQGGGGWCASNDECLQRSRTALGSSKLWPESYPLGGIFSDNKTVNGEFYNWNVVYLGYCDGSSFSGFLQDPPVLNETTLYFRGLPIFLTLVQHLLDNGMENATDIILTGCSAGGVATFLHADLMSTLIPAGVKYKTMADGGYIPNVRDMDNLEFGGYMELVYTLHNMSGGSDEDCVEHFSTEEEWRCSLAPYTVGFIQSPIFVVNSIYDDTILEQVVGLKCLPPSDCSEEQQEVFENYRTEFLAQLAPAVNSSAGIFADSCVIHCQTIEDEPWSTYAVGGKTMRESFEEWYFETGRGDDQRIDCPFPCNPTCRVGDPSPAAGTRAAGGSLGLIAAPILLILNNYYL